MADVDLSAAEQRLVEAVKTGAKCDFVGGHPEVQSERDKADWGPERTIRADLLKCLLTGNAGHWGIEPNAAEVNLCGAVVSGDLIGFDGAQLRLQMSWCRFDGAADFTGATFTSYADFTGATFTGEAWFTGATFTGDAWFTGATFTGNARFGGATFTGDAGFDDATFTGDGWFVSATFTGTAWFPGATFTSYAWFTDATFTGKARFGGATFTGDALFTGATFTGDAGFSGATFTGDAAFREATFTGRADFEYALARHWQLTSSTFLAPDPGPWIGSKVSLNQAVLMARARIEITAIKIEARSLHAREGVHLVLHSEYVDLSDSEFLRRSIVAGPTNAQPIPNRCDVTYEDSLRDPKGAAAIAKGWDLSKTLADKFSKISPTCTLRKLDRSTVGELVLSDVTLDYCTFVGAHGLDKMRIGADCSFRRTRDRSSQSAFALRRIVSQRRIIAEEIAWREAHTVRKGRDANEHDQQEQHETDEQEQPDETPASTLLAADIAGIYRDLRKSLEDVKNEPEAADFYYGEMEMRRLASCARGHGSDKHQLRAPSIMERILLYGYWAVSGYGLRAWRATTVLVVSIVAAALLFSHPGLAIQMPPERIASITDVHTNPPAPGFLTALNFSARETVSLLHADSPSVKTQGAGTLVDFVLRLAGPVLLAFIVLALRARTKR